MKKKNKQNASQLSRRLHFPEDEPRLPWLPLLLDAYSIADTGVAIAIRDAEKKEQKKLACGKGCGNCCVHQKDLPLYPHELVGIYWYASQKMEEPVRGLVKTRLAGPPAPGCPFLVDGSCSIHPMRPVGCRQFNVFSKPCEAGEDPFFTRRRDVLQPLESYIDRAFERVLPLYNMKAGKDPAAGIRTVRGQIMNLLSFDWSKLAALMEKAAPAPTRSEDAAGA
jgi:Fe-S-cluster containining protein